MFLSLKNQIFFEIIRDFLLVLFGFVLSVSIKGFVKALVAKILGDKTPQEDGFLTLNPAGHCDLIQIIPMILVFITILRVSSGSNFSSFLTMIAIAFLESALYPMVLDTRGYRSDMKIAAIQFSGIMTNLFLFVLSGPIILKFAFFDQSNPIFMICRDILSNIAVFSFIRLVIHLPPIPPREGFYIIRPFISYRVESFLEKIGQNIFASIFFSLISAIILLPLLIITFNFSISTIFIFFKLGIDYLFFLIKSLSELIKNMF